LTSIKVFLGLVLQNFARAFLSGFRKHNVQTRSTHSLSQLHAAREALAWLGTTLLLLNLVAAAVMPPHIASAATLAGAFEICSSEGMVWVDEAGHRLKQDGVPSHGVECQFCLPLLHAAFSPPVPPQVPLPLSRVIRGEIAAPIGRFAVFATHPTAQPRAPPAI